MWWAHPLWPILVQATLQGKICAGRVEGRRRGPWDEIVGWHHGHIKAVRFGLTQRWLAGSFQHATVPAVTKSSDSRWWFELGMNKKEGTPVMQFQCHKISLRVGLNKGILRWEGKIISSRRPDGSHSQEEVGTSEAKSREELADETLHSISVGFQQLQL